MIKTIEELEALPEDAVVQEADTNVTIAGASLRHAKMDLPGVFPIVRLIPATISQEQVSDLRGVLYDAGVTGKTLDTAVVEVLSTLGLEVES